MSDIMEAGLSYIAQGFKIFPVKPDKKPLTPHGLKDATQTQSGVREYWTRWPDAGIALVADGLMVLDFDAKNRGLESKVDMEAKYGSLPRTRTHRTGGGGEHFIYRNPNGNDVRNAVTFAGYKGVDLRANGGYIVAPPSPHESGRRYEVLDDSEIAPAPTWLVDLATKKGKTRSHNTPWESQPIPEGQRNSTLTSLAGAMRRRGMSQEAIEAALLEVNRQQCSPPLSEDEVTGISRSVTRYQPEPSPGRSISAALVSGFNLTDLGNAERLVSRYGEILHYCCERKHWMVWNGKVWEWDAGNKVAALAKLAVRKIYHEAGNEPDEKKRKDISSHAAKSESDSRLTGMINLAQSEPGIPIKLTDLDTNHWLFNCRNGTIDLHSGQLLPHRKEDLITVLVPIDYDPDARCDLWMNFLERVTGGNIELITYLQRAVGYSLTGDTRSQTMFFLYGLGSNGKSTFITTIRKLTGGYGAKANTSLFMTKDKNSGGPSEDLANLQGKRFVMASEIEDGRRLAVVLIKEMTGGEVIRADRKYEHEIEFQPVHKIWLVGNHKPVITDTTLSIWRRVKLVPFIVTIANREIDPDLPAKLESELSGILSWAVRGCLEWQRCGPGEPKTVTNATSDYRHEQDILGDFIEDCCLLKPTATVSKHELKAAYEEWCNGAGSQPASQKTFRARLIERGITEGKSGSTRYWKGIALSGSEGQQEQLGQERQMGQEITGNLHMKENQENFGENPVPTSPFVPSEEIPDYPHEPCQICGCGDYRLSDQNQWLCSWCHPKLKGETE
ncbi:MAG: phage/plasmid primase, P4 family [Chloroflexota bacterium]